MIKMEITYDKIYIDDSGKKNPDIFSKYEPSLISIKTLWTNVVDGFLIYNNTDTLITSIKGNIRIVVVVGDANKKLQFEQYFLSELDGKVVKIPSGTKYAIQNMDECKSTYVIATFGHPNIEYFGKSIFNWKKKAP